MTESEKPTKTENENHDNAPELASAVTLECLPIALSAKNEKSELNNLKDQLAKNQTEKTGECNDRE